AVPVMVAGTTALALHLGHPLGSPEPAAALMGLAAAGWGASALRGHPAWALVAWLAAGGCWDSVLRTASLGGDATIYGWWVFCGALAAMTSWSRPNLRPWIEGCAVASTGLVWLGATQAS